MSETTPETLEPAATPEVAFDRDKDRARMRRIGGLHGVAVLAAITLWGAADAWATASGWALASGVAIANAIVAGVVLTSVFHEWGHFAGARFAGSHAPVLAEPRKYFFMFDFDFDANDQRQFFWMSLGGIVTPWLLVLLTLLLVPIDNASRAMLLAVFAGRAVSVAYFELPVLLRTESGGDPRGELVRRLEAGALKTGRHIGLAVTAFVWLAA